MFPTITPAYGRDYKSAKAAKEAWQSGKDFVLCSPFSPDDGRLINFADAKEAGFEGVNIRFDRMTKVTSVKL